MIRYVHFETALGTVLATSRAGAIASLNFIDARYVKPVDAGWVEDRDDALLAQCARELTEYFGGRRRRFDIALAPEGTPFQQRVWAEIARVPWGETVSYGELARRAGAAGRARAAGAATGRNPIGVAIPCHRIVGADGNLTGYAGGLERKRALLELEGVLQRSLV